MCEGAYHVTLDRNRMFVDLLPERLAEDDNVLLGNVAADPTFVCSPEPEAIKERKPAAVPDLRTFNVVLCPEEDRAGKYPLKALKQAAVVRSIGRQSELAQNLRAGTESEFSASHPDSLGRNPDRHQTVLPER